MKVINYEYDPSPASTVPPDSAEKSMQYTGPSKTAPKPLSTQTPGTTPPPRTIASASIPDVPLSAKEIVQSLVAHKLKKGFQEIPLSKSIKELSGGQFYCGRVLLKSCD